MSQIIFRVVVLAILALTFLQCSDPPNGQEIIYVDLGTNFELAYRQTAIIRTADMSISMSTMVADTRCYGDPNCIDPGFVEIELYVSTGSAGGMHLVLGKYGLSWTNEGRALSETWNGYDFELHAVRPDPYEFSFWKRATPPWPDWRVELRVAEESPKPALVTAATPVSYTPAQITLDPFDLDSLSILADTLFVHIAHGGGCKRHYFYLYMSPPTFAESNPVQASFYLRHDDNDDNCRESCLDERCWMNTTLRFELTPVKALHQTVYGTSGPILLNIFDYFMDVPDGKLQILYSP